MKMSEKKKGQLYTAVLGLDTFDFHDQYLLRFSNCR